MAAKREVFSRRTSGLVRDISPHQAWIYNFLAIGFFTFTWATLFSYSYSSVFSGGNVGLAIILMTVFGIPFYVCTSMLSSAMPRSGGDYVWQSRVLHPFIGFASTLSAWTIWQWYFAGYSGVVTTTFGLQPFFALLGLNNSYFAGIAATLAAGYGQIDNTAVFVVTTVIILLGFIIAALGMKFYVRLQYLLFAGATISALAIILMFATTSHAQFVARFNEFAAPLIAAGNQTQVSSSQVAAAGGYYQYIINTANLGPVSFSPWNTLLLCGIVWLSLGYGFWSIYNLAEIKSAGSFKMQSLTQIGSVICFSIFLLAIWYTLENTIGIDFLRAFFTLYANFDPSTNPIAYLFTPYFPILAALISTNPIIWAIILLGLMFGTFQVILIIYFASTRILFAASIDRVLPEKLSYVSGRTHSPLVTLIISVLGCEAFLYVIIYDSSFTSYFSTAGLATQIAYIMISVTAILFPFRKKEVFEASPAGKYKILGFPIVSIMGVLSLIVNVFIAWIYGLGPPLGFLSISTQISIEFVIGIFVLCGVIYCVAWAIRRNQGIDLSLSFKEMPPQ